MAEILRYVLVDADDNEGEYEYETLDEAKADASQWGSQAIICRTYEYTDSELVWTPNGADTWPPAPEEDPS